MVTPPEIYTGAQFTLRYDECTTRLTQFYQDSHLAWEPFGIEAVFQYCEDHELVRYAEYPNIVNNRGWIVKRFEVRNKRKELSAETPDAWFDLAVQRLCEIAAKWEPILKMENSTGFDVSNPSKESRTIEYGHVVEGQVQDTPYGELNAESDYVTGKTAEQHSGRDVITERNDLDADILMDIRRRWESTINLIVEDFDVLFIRVTGGNFIA